MAFEGNNTYNICQANQGFNNFPVAKRQRTFDGNGNTDKTMNCMFFKTKPCEKFNRNGECSYGDRCTYAHGLQDQRPHVRNWREIAANKNRNDYVTNAHGAAPLQRARQEHFDFHATNAYRENSAINITINSNNNVDANFPGHVPVSVPQNRDTSDHRKTLLCRMFGAKGFCTYGDQCKFAHGQEELKRTASVEAGKEVVENTVAVPKETKAESGWRIPANIQRKFERRGIKGISRIYGDWIEDDDSQ